MVKKILISILAALICISYSPHYSYADDTDADTEEISVTKISEEEDKNNEVVEPDSAYGILSTSLSYGITPLYVESSAGTALGVGASTNNIVTNTAVGYYARANGMNHATAVGAYATINGSSTEVGTAIGAYAYIADVSSCSVALGYGATIDNSSSGAYMFGSMTAIGASSNNAYALGSATEYNASFLASRGISSDNIVSTVNTNTSQTIYKIIGDNSYGSYAIGTNAYIGTNSIYSYTMGTWATVADNTSYAYAIGYYSSAVASNAIALGNYAVADEEWTISVGGGDSGQNYKIVNMAAGAITATSMDAVNGSQIHSLGTTIANILGDGWSFNNGTFTGSWSIGGNSYTSLTAILTDIQDTLDSLPEEWTFGTSSSTTSEGESSEGGGSSSTSGGTGSESGTSSGTSQIRAGDTLIVEGGRNVVISGPSASELEDGSTEHTYTISVSDNPEFDSVTVADGTVVINENGISISNSEGDTTITINGDTGIDMGWTNITNVGNLSADTINVNQSLTIGDVINISNTGIDMGGTSITNVKSIQIGDYTISETSDGYDFGGGVITNIGDGGIYSGSTDVVAGNQLWEAYQSMNTMEETLKERINTVGAHAAALSGLHPIQYNPDEPTTLSAAVGTYRDEYAVGVGMFHYTKDSFMFNLGGSIGSDGNLMGRAGLSIRVPTTYGVKRKKEMIEMQEQITLVYKQMKALQKENEELEQLIAANRHN